MTLLESRVESVRIYELGLDSHMVTGKMRLLKKLQARTYVERLFNDGLVVKSFFEASITAALLGNPWCLKFIETHPPSALDPKLPEDNTPRPELEIQHR